MNTTTQNQKSEMKNYLYFAGTIYDSFEALEEVLGKLKLERPLFLLYAAKKAYAEEVFAAAGEKPEKSEKKREETDQEKMVLELFDGKYID